MGNFALLSESGPSALGTAYLARHSFLDTDARVTLLPPQTVRDAGRVATLGITARCAPQLGHASLLPLIEVGRDGRQVYVVEAAPEGRDLGALVHDGAIDTIAEQIAVVGRVGQALAELHRRSIVHGGLHPGVVFVSGGAPRRVRVSGWVAGVPWSTAGWHPAVEGFLAPEVRDATPHGWWGIDARADVYSVAALLQFMLGRLLVGYQPWEPQRLTAAVPDQLAGLLERAMDPRPDGRPSTMASLLEELAGISDRPVVALDGSLPLATFVGPPLPPPPTTPLDAEIPREVRGPLPRRRPSAGERWHRPGTMRWVAAGAVAAGALLLVRAGTTLRPESKLPTTVPVSGGTCRMPPLPVTPIDWQDAASIAATDPYVSRIALEGLDPPSAPAAPRRWVRNHPPRVLAQMPPAARPLRVAEGDTIALGVRAADPDPGDRLGYRWLVGGKVVAWGPRWRFLATPPTGQPRTVELQVIDRRGEQAAPVRWRVEVVPRMREVDARDWLERLREAWERKDIATLKLYGIVTTDAQARGLRKMLDDLDHYKVAFHDQQVRVAGQYATVSFKRTDRDGSEVVGLTDQRYELEKRPSGLVALRASVPTS